MAADPGDVVADDDSLGDETRILRRIPAAQVIRDGDSYRPRSDAFQTLGMELAPLSISGKMKINQM